MLPRDYFDNAGVIGCEYVGNVIYYFNYHDGNCIKLNVGKRQSAHLTDSEAYGEINEELEKVDGLKVYLIQLQKPAYYKQVGKDFIIQTREDVLEEMHKTLDENGYSLNEITNTSKPNVGKCYLDEEHRELPPSIKKLFDETWEKNRLAMDLLFR